MLSFSNEVDPFNFFAVHITCIFPTDALFGIVVLALELIPASKRMFGSDTPHGNTRMPRTLDVLGNYIPDQVILDWHGLVSDMFRTRWTCYYHSLIY